MPRTTAASLFALAFAALPAQAQTVLYGDPPPPQPIFPQPQPYFGGAQPVPAQPPLYYETVPAVQPPPVFPDDERVRRFRTIPQGETVPTRPIAPAERYWPPAAPARPDPAVAAPAPAAPVLPAPPTIARPEPRPAAPPPAPRPDGGERPRAEAPVAPGPRVTESEALRDFSTELARIVTLGERYRAATPGFLEDLRALSEKYAALPVRIETAAAPEPEPEQEEQELVGPPPPSDLLAAGDGEPDAPGETEMAMAPEPEPEPEPDPAPEPAMASEPDPGAEPEELPQALPPTSAAVVYLRDDFSDGDYLSNPAWSVRQGQFTVDPAYGLRPFSPESAEPAQVTPQALLQYLIGDSKPEAPKPSGESGASLIEAPVSIGNAFSLVTTITDHGGEGAAHFIVHQGGANWLGYRLELRAGPRPLVVLARRGSSGYKDIMKVEAPAFTTGKPHQLRWARLSDGQMFVLIDGRPVITARDTVFRQPWTGFAWFTADADVSMRNIRIAEPVER